MTKPPRWDAYWTEMERLCTGLEKQQSVTEKTRGLTFIV